MVMLLLLLQKNVLVFAEAIPAKIEVNLFHRTDRAYEKT